jgi:anti-sigma regulatory factor (Ser/Thr protein kinase)
MPAGCRRLLTSEMSQTIFDADFDNLDEIRELVGEAARQVGFSNKEIYAIQLAADEASSNIIEHAYAGVTGGTLEIDLSISPKELKIVMRDHGKSFDPSSVPEPNVKADLSERKIGGLGMYLMRKLMDEVSYESSLEKGNTLTMIKRLGESG